MKWKNFCMDHIWAVNKDSFIFFIGAEGAEKERMKKVNDILRDKDPITDLS